MFNSSKDRNHDAVLNSNGRASSAETRYTTSCSGKDDNYRLQGKVMFSEASVSHSSTRGDLSSQQRLPRNWHLVVDTAAVGTHFTGMHSCYWHKMVVQLDEGNNYQSTNENRHCFAWCKRFGDDWTHAKTMELVVKHHLHLPRQATKSFWTNLSQSFKLFYHWEKVNI